MKLIRNRRGELTVLGKNEAVRILLNKSVDEARKKKLNIERKTTQCLNQQ